MEDDDLVLLDRWCAGDTRAGNALFKRHIKALIQFFEHKTDSRSFQADDLLQETFLALVRGRDSFRRTSSFRTYLFAIARNVLHGYWKKKAVRGTNVDFEEISIASLTTSVGSRIARGEARAQLLAALRDLPVEQQLLLELHYWENLTCEQLAEVFDVEPATIRSRLFRARAALHRRLAGNAAQASGLPGDGDLDQWARELRADVDLVRNDDRGEDTTEP